MTRRACSMKQTFRSKVYMPPANPPVACMAIDTSLAAARSARRWFGGALQVATPLSWRVHRNVSRLSGGKLVTEANTAAMQRLLDKQAITEVLHRYARGVDRCDRSILEIAYWPDAIDDHIIFKASGDELLDNIC